jgi:hypothetical protein
VRKLLKWLADPRATVKAAVIGAMGLIAAAIVAGIYGITVALIPVLSGSSATSSVPATSSTPVAQTPSCPSAAENAPEGQLIGEGPLTLEGNGTAYDLDAVDCGWAPLAGANWIAQNIMYAPTGYYKNKPVIDIAGSPYTDVVMPGGGPWDYQDCANAPYGADPSTTGPNAVAGASLKVGKGICVETSNTGQKHDGNHIVLIQIRTITNREVTAWVTVWY